VSSPAKFALSYLLIDVYLASHFPQLFIRYNPGPPDLHDISQASVYKGLNLSLNLYKTIRGYNNNNNNNNNNKK
jgi:hypothetical protein